MMNETGYDLEEIEKIQKETGVGNTPILELRNLTKLARKFAPQKERAPEFLLKTKLVIHLVPLRLEELPLAVIMPKDWAIKE